MQKTWRIKPDEPTYVAGYMWSIYDQDDLFIGAFETKEDAELCVANSKLSGKKD